MRLTPSITIRNIPHTEALEIHLQNRIDKLSQFYDRIMHCDIVIEQAQKNKHNGKLYNARISITVPGEEITATNAINEDVYIAIRDTFSAVRRRLQGYARKRRGEIKNHAIPLHGHISKIYPTDGFGFIECNGDEYYFSPTNLSNVKFNQLDLGMPVHFLASVANDGFQANRIVLERA